MRPAWAFPSWWKINLSPDRREYVDESKGVWRNRVMHHNSGNQRIINGQWRIWRKLDSNLPLKRKWTFVRQGPWARRRELPKPDILYVNGSSIEGGWAEQGNVLTWGRPVGYDPEICNYDINLLSTTAMLLLRSQGVADLLVVVIKRHAYENMVTYLRIKQAERGRKTKGKGADTLTKCNHMHWLLRLWRQKTCPGIEGPPYEVTGK